MVATPAAQETGLPPKVLMWSPGSNASAMSSRAMNAPSGKPLAIPLAMVMMSGSTSYASTANIRPLRPNPLCTSSTMSRMPLGVEDLLDPLRYPSGNGMMPPSPMIGSTMNAATSSLVS